MKISFAFVVCVLLFSGCSGTPVSTKGIACVEEANKSKLDSFITQFAQYGNKLPDKSFFRVREKYPTEICSPEINKYFFSFLLPYDDDWDCVAKELYYRPCYRIEQDNFHLVAMEACCDVVNSGGYPCCYNILATYGKNGKFIDFATVGKSSDIEYCRIEPATGEYEMIYTQYRFDDVESVYNGEGEISVYNVAVDSNGAIRKHLLRKGRGRLVSE